MLIKNLSVFFPVFNEEGNITATVKKAIEVLENLKLEYEIIIVDDGSTDQTGQIANRLADANSHIKLIQHPKNLGYGEALKSGFYNAKYETITYTDGDGQFDFHELNKFLEKIKDYDLVLGYRIKRQDPFFRILFKKGWKLTLLTFFGLRFKDVDCGFKMIKKRVLEKIPHLEAQRGAMISAELAIKTKKYGFKIAQVGVNHYPRLSGKPTGASLNVIIRSYFDLIKLWWKLKEEKRMFLVLLGILFLALVLRIYKIDQYMTFLGDQGRDAIIVKDMQALHHFPLIGPPTSVGNIYLGPLYYYMMFIPMAISKFNPVSASLMVALIGVLTVWLIYYLGKIWFGKNAGLIASFLYAISPVTINYSNFSWNPNPAPFFSLLAMWTFYKAHQKRDFRWLILTGALVGAALQMHYLAAILLPIFAILWLYEIFRRKHEIKNLISGTLLGISSFILVMSPLVWFDLRHNFLNYRAVTKLLTSGSTLKGNIFVNILRIPQIFGHDLVGRYMASENLFLIIILSALIILSLLRKSWPVFCLWVWMGVGVLGLSFYQGKIFDHYLNFLNPTPYLLLGSITVYTFRVSTKSRWLVVVGILTLLGILTMVNLQKNPLRNPPNNQLKRTQDVAKFIIKASDEKPFNFALIAKNNYDSAYQFYLDQYGHKPKQVPFTIADQLFVVCEDQVCDPTHNAKYEVAAFGWSKIEWEKDVIGVKLFKLVHNPSGKP